MTKHILLYTDDPGIGGVAQYNHTILLGLVSRGYRVTHVQTRRSNPLLEEQERAGVQHEWLEYDTVKEFGRTFGDPSDAKEIFARTQPDLILFSDSCPISDFAAKEVAMHMGIPYVVVIGFVAPYLARHFGPGVESERYLAMLGRQYEAAQAVVAVSQENLELLYDLFHLPPNKGQVIHYGRPESYFAPRNAEVRDRLRQEVGIPADAIVCFTAARLEQVKGFQYQLDAIAALKETPAWSNLYFVWAGDGTLREPLQQAIEELEVGDRVKLLGQRWDVADWHDAVDMFVFPSQLEGMPLAVMEAMAKGVPVMASAVSGIPEELGETGKLLTDPGQDYEATIREMVETIAQWAADAELRQTIGEACRQRAQRMFRLYRMEAETIAVLQRALLPPGDYVSPGLAIVQPDAAFPNMVVGDPMGCPWPYLRREIPHNWYVDRRQPVVGFLSRDEAHILYNLALPFKGKRALEIGCWMGWSACHLALAGVQLDLVDPLLERPEFFESVSSSLWAAGVLDTVRLIPGFSPQAVEEVAASEHRKWSLIFIDGNHEAPGPLNDAIACEPFAEEDALIVFHDLASPDVAQGLDYYKQQGWNTLIYQTMQIMGVAWRGNVTPVRHQPDPRVSWQLPAHLQGYEVSGAEMLVTASAQGQPGSRGESAAPAAVLGESVLEWMIHHIEGLQPHLTTPIPHEPDAIQQAVALTRQGQEAYVQGDWLAALSAFNQAVAHHPGSAIAHTYLSVLHWYGQNLTQSLQHHLWAKSAHIDLGRDTYSEFQDLVAVVRPYTLLSEQRLFSLYALTKQICLEDLPGNFVECGTFKGGAAALMAAVIQKYSQRPRKLYACDTFEGMPDPLEVDKHEGIPANDTDFGAGTLKAPIAENLAVVCAALGVTDRVVPLKGLFKDTLPAHRDEIGAIALLHADGDWYESTLDIFNTLYDSVLPNGAIQIDDYGFWEGCRKAIHEFERQRRALFALRIIDPTGVWFRKDDTIDQECCHWQTVWQLAQWAERLGDRALAQRAVNATLKLMPNLVMAEAMRSQWQSPGSDTPLLQAVSRAIALYQQNPTHANALADLRQLRQQVAETWLNLEPEQLAAAYAGELGQAQAQLMASGLKEEPLTETDEAIAFQVIATLSEGLHAPGGVTSLLAAMLYCYPHHLPDPFDLTVLPPGLVDGVVQFMTAMPVMFQEIGDVDDYAAYLERWMDYLYEHIQAHPDSPLWQQVTQTVAYSANLIPLYFTTRNVRAIYEKRAAIIERSLVQMNQAVDYEFPSRLSNPRSGTASRRKIRLGVLANHFKPQTETFATLPVFKHLDRQVFEVCLFSVQPLNHRLDLHCLSYADAVVELPSELAEQVKTLREADLDVLFIATNVTAVTNRITLLASHRLARVQVMGMNSPVTSGMRHTDVYLTGHLSHPEWNLPAHYRETLVELDGAAQCFDFATEAEDEPTELPSRDRLGIAEDAVVFVSGANFHKITPELMAAWAKILAGVPQSRLMLYPFNPNWSNRYPVAAFCRQLAAHLAAQGVEADRALVLEAAPSRADVLERLKLADVYLDSFPFSGMTSLLDPLHLGLPPVVMELATPVSAARGAAFLRELAAVELIAEDEATYVQTAIALGLNPEKRQELRDRLRRRMAQLPSFLDSARYGSQMTSVFQTLVQTYQQKKLVEEFRLRQHNWMAFPDWAQPEEVLWGDLADLLRKVMTHPERQRTTLLIDVGEMDEQEADLALSSVTLHLLTEEGLEMDEDGPEITLLGKLKAAQWQALLPYLTARVPLAHEDLQAIARAGAELVPSVGSL